MATAAAPVSEPAACECEGCRAACETRPGFFRADEIEPLAHVLGLSVDEMVKRHLQFDYFEHHEIADGEEVRMLVPRLKGHVGGSRIPWWPTGRCHWFVDGKCAIHTKGKPAECRGLGHIDGADVSADRVAIVRTWLDRQDWVRALMEKHLP